MQPRQQRLRIFTLQIINAAVRWIADEAAIMRDGLCSLAQRGQHLGNRPGIAGEDEAAAQGDTERSARRMMPNFEHIEPQPLMPEPARERHDAEGIPVIGTTFGQNAGIVRHALLHPRHQRRWQVKPAIAAAGRVEIKLHEQALHAGHVIHVRMRQEQRTRRLSVTCQIRTQGFLAAVDHQDRLAITLQHRAGRPELHRAGAANAKKMQIPVVHGTSSGDAPDIAAV